MSEKLKHSAIRSAALFFIFCLYTLLVQTVDVRTIGPNGSSVGFAALNRLFLRENVSSFWYGITVLLGYMSLLLAAAFAALAVCQFVKGGFSLKKTNIRLVLLCVFYAMTAAACIFFKLVIVNYRPVLMDGELEASYPSFHTMLGICILSAAMMQYRFMIENSKKLMYAEAGSALLLAVMVLGRLLSGVQWFTDILGAVLISAALLSVYLTMLDAAEHCGAKTRKRISLRFLTDRLKTEKKKEPEI